MAVKKKTTAKARMPRTVPTATAGRRRSIAIARHTAPDAAPRKRAPKLRVVEPVAVVEPEMDPRDARDLARGRPQRHHGA